MKTRLSQFILAFPLVLLSTSAHAALVGIDSASGTLADGSGVTYTVITTGPALNFGGWKSAWHQSLDQKAEIT